MNWSVLIGVCGFMVLWNVINYMYSQLFIKVRFNNLSKEDLEAIDKMSSRDFESFLQTFFVERGYQITVPQRKGMQNYFMITKDDISTAVRFYKFSINQRLTPNATYHALTGKVYGNCKGAMLITTTFFTAEAEREAKRNNVEVWDRTRLFAEISDYLGKREIDWARYHAH